MKKKTNTAEIFLSVESLHHFRCGACNKWWSIGDAEKRKKEWFCPWCGVLQRVVPHMKAARIKRKY